MFFPSPSPRSPRLPSCSPVPPFPFPLQCLVKLIMSVHSFGRDSHILCLLPVLSCYSLLPRDVRVSTSRALCVILSFISYENPSYSFAPFHRRLDDSPHVIIAPFLEHSSVSRFIQLVILHLCQPFLLLDRLGALSLLSPWTSFLCLFLPPPLILARHL